MLWLKLLGFVVCLLLIAGAAASVLVSFVDRRRRTSYDEYEARLVREHREREERLSRWNRWP